MGIITIRHHRHITCNSKDLSLKSPWETKQGIGKSHFRTTTWIYQNKSMRCMGMSNESYKISCRKSLETHMVVPTHGPLTSMVHSNVFNRILAPRNLNWPSSHAWAFNRLVLLPWIHFMRGSIHMKSYLFVSLLLTYKRKPWACIS